MNTLMFPYPGVNFMNSDAHDDVPVLCPAELTLSFSRCLLILMRNLVVILIVVEDESDDSC